MANGTTRIALAQMKLGKGSASEEQKKLMALAQKGSKLPKFPLKYPNKANRSSK